LKTETCDYEEKEAELVKDCVRQLADANKQVAVLAEDLGKKTDSYLDQQEEITNLLAKVCNLEAKIKKVCSSRVIFLFALKHITLAAVF
jgi:trafficking kinesin-binding protein 1